MCPCNKYLRGKKEFRKCKTISFLGGECLWIFDVDLRSRFENYTRNSHEFKLMKSSCVVSVHRERDGSEEV